MTYNTKYRVLSLGVYEKVCLTRLEHKFLICLSSGTVTKYEEIRKYLGFNYISDLRVIKNRLINKTNYQLKIQTFRSVGYRLKSEIYFE